MAPILTDDSFDIITHSQTQTQRIGQKLGAMLRPGDVVCLIGDLGSGKTCLTQGIGASLQVDGIISSPTFVIVNEYPIRASGPSLYHVDLYRINEPAEIMALGLDDYMYGNGVTVIEWAERGTEYLPDERLWITLSYLDYTKRCLIFEAQGEHYIEIVHKLRAELYGKGKTRDRSLDDQGEPTAAIGGE